MHTPDGLAPLLDDGIIQRVLRPLMSGKEAQVYLVESRDMVCVAKVYKEAHARTFKNRAEYTEGRKTRNSRDQRAMQKGSRHGRAQDEAAWRSTEVDMIHRLHAAGVRVPVPYIFIDGVLVMECIGDAEGNPAPRLSDVAFEPDEARAIYTRIIQEIVRMLAVGVVHGDLSEFNVLLGADGPVIIDFPQSVDTASNTNARRLLLRDVENFHRFLARNVPGAPRFPYAEEMWDLHELNALTAETRLTGRYRAPQRRFSSGESVHELIRDANRDEQKRRESLGLRGGPRELAEPGQAGRGGEGPRGGDRQAAPQRDGDRPETPQRGSFPARDARPRRSVEGQGAQGQGAPAARPQGAPGQGYREPRGDQRAPAREGRRDVRAEQRPPERVGQHEPTAPQRDPRRDQRGDERGPPRENQPEPRAYPRDVQGGAGGAPRERMRTLDRPPAHATPQRYAGAQHTADRPPSRGHHGAPAEPRRDRDAGHAPPTQERERPRERSPERAPQVQERPRERSQERGPQAERPHERAPQRTIDVPRSQPPRNHPPRSHAPPQPPRRPEGQRPAAEPAPQGEPQRQRPSRRQARTAPEIFIVRRPK